MTSIRILDVTDRAGFDRIAPCADPGFDHRTCDYWEDEVRGSKAARLAWLQANPAPERPPRPSNPFAPAEAAPQFNPFDPRAAAGRGKAFDPFAADDDDADANATAADAAPDNPFLPRREKRPAVGWDAPRKLQLLGRGLGIFGSYAKVLERDDEPAVYCQFGPLSAYPRAQRVRDLYPQLPSAPLPAVITCIASTAAARRQGLARQLVMAVIDDLTSRGFSAVEAYPEPGVRLEATSAANPAFWLTCGFAVAVDDEQFPVVRREL
jgi:GNAT superfamily N-acetyltransferase